MLLKLSIKNYALIRETEITFHSGYTAVTGETGAGKSVILGAVGLLLGDRADLSAIPNKENKCVIEGEFELSRLNLVGKFADNQWDYDSHTVIRREWLPTGKSRAFINDTPVQVQDLKLLGSFLIEIHSQHSALTITKSSEQLHALDIYAENLDLLNQYQSTHKQLLQKQRTLKELELELMNLIQEREFKKFQWEEIQQVKPVTNEEKELESEIALLNSAEEIVASCKKSSFLLSESEQSVYEQLSEIKQHIKGISAVSLEFGEYQRRIDSLLTEVKELARDLSNSSEKTNPNPEKLQALEERFGRLQHLFRKHRTDSSEQLIAIAEQLEQSESETIHSENQLDQTRAEIETLHQERAKLAEQLSQQRKTVLLEFSIRIQQDLLLLEMPYVQVELKLVATEPGITGSDSLLFLFSANKGIELQELSKCASGGEISRVNFCIRNLIAEKKSLPTLIYDEADTGVSGQVATRIGTLLRKQGRNQQVLAITHLPQVAAAGEKQLYVYKSHAVDFSETHTKYLSASERELEIATMLSGNNPSQSALAAANDLISSYAH